ncbi:hypothetical protein Dimus_011012 [Dionaea muscipula]
MAEDDGSIPVLADDGDGASCLFGRAGASSVSLPDCLLMEIWGWRRSRDWGWRIGDRVRNRSLRFCLSMEEMELGQILFVDGGDGIRAASMESSLSSMELALPRWN